MWETMKGCVEAPAVCLGLRLAGWMGIVCFWQPKGIWGRCLDHYGTVPMAGSIANPHHRNLASRWFEIDWLELVNQAALFPSDEKCG